MTDGYWASVDKANRLVSIKKQIINERNMIKKKGKDKNKSLTYGGEKR